MNIPLPTTEQGLREHIVALRKQWEGILDGVIPAALPYVLAAKVMLRRKDAQRGLRNLLRRKHPHMSAEQIAACM